MTDLDTILANATANGNVPFVVAMHGDASSVKWVGTSGNSKKDVPATQDAVFRIFSMTKAVGSLAAMILVDRGQLDMDTSVEDILPEFAKVQVLEGFDGDTPILRAPKSKATIRQLATHTSGLVYQSWNKNCAKYLEVTGTAASVTGEMSSLYSQMASDPGERWEYGIGIDWLGQIVEKVDGRRIDEFCQQEIFEPLDMPDTAFELNDSMRSRLVQVYQREADGQFVETELSLRSNPEYYGMGHCLYSTAPDYMNFIRMFLNKGQLNGTRILSEQAMEKMLANNIGDLRIGKTVSYEQSTSADIDFFPDIEKSHSLGFMRMEQDVPGMRSAGSQSWAGVCNTHYWFDPASNVAGLIMTQTLPFVEKPYMDLYESFERAIYSE